MFKVKTNIDVIKNYDLIESLSFKENISTSSLQLLLNRFYKEETLTEDSIKKFLTEHKVFLKNERINLDDYLNTTIQQASKELCRLIKENKKILVITDYDCDGINSAAVIFKTLKKVMKDEDFKIVVNKRKFGNGINQELLDTINDLSRYDVLITADHGSSNESTFKYLKSLNPNLKIFLTDHHTFKENDFPHSVDFFINNQLYVNDNSWEKLKNLSGCCIAFIFMYSILKDFGTIKNNKDQADYLFELSDHLFLTVISDVMPLNDKFNRFVSKLGQRKMNSNNNKLFNVVKNFLRLDDEIKPSSLRFNICPLINTGNRLHCEDVVYDLLTTNNNENLIENIDILNGKNNIRKKITNNLIDNILENNSIFGTDGLTVAISTELGINGIIAAKLGGLKQKPITCFTSGGEHYHGSCRSIVNGFNIITVLEEINKLGILEGYGGHKEAAGCQIKKENINLFAKEFDRLSREQLKEIPQTEEINVDGIIKLSNINMLEALSIETLEPYGKDFDIPIFYSEADIVNFHIGETVTFVTLGTPENQFKAVSFKNGLFSHEEIFGSKKRIGFTFNMSIEFYRGSYKLNIIITNAKILNGDNLLPTTIEEITDSLLSED